MNIERRSAALIIGMALFAMFFGSGNLIYPLYIGKIADGSWLLISTGFLIAGVLLPFLGVIAMVLYKGSYDNFFKTIGHIPGFLLMLLLLTVWIPLGSAPRCMTLAYASLASYLEVPPPLWIFSVIYSLAVFYVITRKLGVFDILGKYITPVLLLCLGVIFFKGIIESPGIVEVENPETSSFFRGLVEGYNTMDLIASFFFSASIIHMLTHAGAKMGNTLSLVIKASIIGMAILGTVYLCMISVAAYYAPMLEGVPKDQLLAHLAQVIMGPTWSLVAIVAIFLACFSTSIALVIVYADFLQEEILRGVESPYPAILISLGVTYVMSMFGLEGITYVTAPVLQVCYPILLVLIVVNIGKMWWKKSRVMS